MAVDNNSQAMRETADYLKAKEFTYGYAKFYTGNVLPELTNGQIDVYCVEDFDGMISSDWLMKTSLSESRGRDNQHKTFVLMNWKEYEENKELEYVKRGHVSFQNDVFIVLEYKSDEALWEMIDS